MPVQVTSKGTWDKTTRYLNKLQKSQITAILDRYGTKGVDALANATPRDTGLTAQSWGYSIVQRKGYYSIIWHNTYLEDGKPIAILLQYGHGTRTGGYVQGRDYIMPAIRPIFDQIAKDVWKEVTS